MLLSRVGFRAPRGDEVAAGGDAGPCVMWELVEVARVGGTAMVCVGAGLCGFCGGLFCAALSVECCWSPAQRFGLKGH